MSTHELVKDYITQEFAGAGGGRDISATDQLIETGIIDSFGIMVLITFLEETFAIKIESQDLLPENFGSINKIAELIDRIKGQA